MIAHNIVALRNLNHPEKNFMLTGFEQLLVSQQKLADNPSTNLQIGTNIFLSLKSIVSILRVCQYWTCQYWQYVNTVISSYWVICQHLVYDMFVTLFDDKQKSIFRVHQPWNLRRRRVWLEEKFHQTLSRTGRVKVQSIRQKLTCIRCKNAQLLLVVF